MAIYSIYALTPVARAGKSGAFLRPVAILVMSHKAVRPGLSLRSLVQDRIQIGHN